MADADMGSWCGNGMNVPNYFFSQRFHKRTILGSPKNLSVKKIIFFSLCVEHFNNLKNRPCLHLVLRCTLVDRITSR